MSTLNLGILTHVDAGKTTLTEWLLYAAGVIDEIGSVDDGSTQTDSLALERQRSITIKSAVVSFVVDGVTGSRAAATATGADPRGRRARMRLRRLPLPTGGWQGPGHGRTTIHSTARNTCCTSCGGCRRAGQHFSLLVSLVIRCAICGTSMLHPSAAWVVLQCVRDGLFETQPSPFGPRRVPRWSGQ